MNAHDVMTTKVVAVSPDTPTNKIAELLLENGISAIPVVDGTGAPIGMVSEGDLIGRDEAAREARRDWWLALLADGTELNADYLASLRAPERTARDIMAAPVVTVSEETGISEIAHLLVAYRIKRVPVVRDGRVIGIVSRADLLRGLAEGEPKPAAPGDTGGAGTTGHRMFAWRDKQFPHAHRSESGHPTAQPLAAPREEAVSVEDFRGLVADFERHEAHHHDEARRAVAQQLRQKTKELIDHHISDDSWRTLVHQARQAAEHGQKEWMLLRLPSQLCSDGGRAVNAPRADWPNTLRGEAAEIYLRWERDLKPHGFGIAARVLDFPGGMPGDIGLFLVWG
jgi:CBS domain-containing protein